MPDVQYEQYSEDELAHYFHNPKARRSRQEDPEQMHRRQAQRAIRFLVIASFVLALIALLFMVYLSRSTPSLDELVNPDVSLATIVYTNDGEVLTRYSLTEDRTTVPYDSISPHVIHAFIATEDRRYYDHWGMDLYRTVGAVVKTLLGDRQGGSTITQQLARNLYAEQVGGRAITVQRKLREWITAVQIERNYSKREIIELYLNTVPFGYRTYGIQTAAQTYFGVSARDLNLEQSATLVGMLKGPSFYNPVKYPDRVKSRRDNVVLNQMVRFGTLPEAVADSIKQIPLELHFSQITHTENLAPYFAEYVRLRLDEWAEQNGMNTYTDGLRVYTTLDSRYQRMAEEAVARQMVGLQAVVDVEHSSMFPRFYSAEIEPYVENTQAEGFVGFDQFWAQETELVDRLMRKTDRYRNLVRRGATRAKAVEQLRADSTFIDSLRIAETRLEVGLTAIDPNTREVKAWVGGRDFNVGKLDHVAGTRRQPGSTFKPFLYTAAIDNDYSPYYTLLDDTITIWLPGMPEPWSPENSGLDYTRRPLTLRDGLRMSKNSIAARLVTEIGAEQVKAYAERMGIRSPLEPVPAIALGTSDVSLLEMTNAYATLANGGFASDPIVITRIEDSQGRVLEEFYPNQSEVLSEYTTYTVLDMMRGTLQPGGTGVRIRNQFGIEADVTAKTGTTQNGADGWFMLMHPQLVVGAWVGFNEPAIRFKTSYWGQGAHNALFVVGDFFKDVLENEEVDLPDNEFLPPDGWRAPLPMIPVNTEDPDKLNSKKKGRVGW